MLLKTRVGIIKEAPQTNFLMHIKELRALTDLGLKEAKEMADEVYEKGHIEYEPKTQYQYDAFRNAHYWALVGVPPKFTPSICVFDTLKSALIELVNENEFGSAKLVINAIQKLKQ